ncbi:VOC family protein [Gordonia sp. VNK1]|uniref:VOC family protein n=1 Tax=Gordonia oleivorans TaxID=3156618 RepID=UPI0032B4DDA0
MTLTVGMITVDSTDPIPLARWWAERIGGTVIAENDGFFVMVSGPAAGAPVLGFQQVDDPTPGKNRIHLDLTTTDIDAEVESLVAAGATRIADHELGDFAWVTLADPDGNQFCVSLAHEPSA